MAEYQLGLADVLAPKVVSFKMDVYFIRLLDEVAKEFGLTRSELLRALACELLYRMGRIDDWYRRICMLPDTRMVEIPEEVSKIVTDLLRRGRCR